VGTDAGQVGVSGSSVTYGGVEVGTVAGGESGTSPLVVTFNASATPSIATAVLRNVTFAHLSDTPAAPLGRTLVYRMSDGVGGTSAEVVQTITIRPVNDAPVLGGIAATVSYVENDVIAPAASATVSDVDSVDVGGGRLTVSVAVNPQSTDRLQIANAGVEAGQVGVSGANVTFGGLVVGTFTGGTSGTAALIVTFNVTATPAVAEAVLRAVRYRSVSEHPLPATRGLRYVLTDGDGGTSVAVNQTVEMTPVNDAPVLGGIGAALSYTENAVLLVAAAGTVTDVDNPTLPGATLEVAVTSNGHADDRLRIRHVGTAAGQVGVSGSSVTYGGVEVGTVAGGESGTSPLVVTFNASATPSIATLVLRNVTFAHLSDAPRGRAGAPGRRGDGGRSRLADLRRRRALGDDHRRRPLDRPPVDPRRGCRGGADRAHGHDGHLGGCGDRHRRRRHGHRAAVGRAQRLGDRGRGAGPHPPDRLRERRRRSVERRIDAVAHAALQPFRRRRVGRGADGHGAATAHRGAVTGSASPAASGASVNSSHPKRSGAWNEGRSVGEKARAASPARSWR